jgi:hypothetical protein
MRSSFSPLSVAQRFHSIFARTKLSYVFSVGARCAPRPQRQRPRSADSDVFCVPNSFPGRCDRGAGRAPTLNTYKRSPLRA